jgi:hypothetical protein
MRDKEAACAQETHTRVLAGLPRGVNFKLRGESEAQGVELFYSQLTAVELRQVGGRDIGVPAERARAGDG